MKDNVLIFDDKMVFEPMNIEVAYIEYPIAYCEYCLDIYRFILFVYMQVH